MELHQRNPIFGSGETVGKRLRDVCLSRAWRPLEDDLTLVYQAANLDLFKEFVAQ